MMNKPPLGLIPKNIWDNIRLADVYGAINRYFLDKKEIPIEWIQEYNEIIRRNGERK